MWLRYQQASAKMSSFDPREFVNNKDDQVVKYSLKKFEPTLRSSLRVVIPMNLDRLRKHKSNIEKFAYRKDWKSLNIEQINASRTVQQLNATIRDLDKMKYQIQEEDLPEFEKLMTPIKNEAIAAFQEFSDLQNLISSEVQKSINCSTHDMNDDSSSMQLYNSENAESFRTNEQNENQEIFPNGPITRQIQLADSNRNAIKEEMDACQSWDNLRDGLIDLNDLVKDFAAAVHLQQEKVDSIDDNVADAHENVRSAAGFLSQASKYKMAAIPLAGAIVGGLVGGPIGLLAGFKLAGAAAAVGGGVAGYQGGKYLQKRHDNKVEVELSNLSKKDDENVRLTSKDKGT